MAVASVCTAGTGLLSSLLSPGIQLIPCLSDPLPNPATIFRFCFPEIPALANMIKPPVQSSVLPMNLLFHIVHWGFLGLKWDKG